MLYLAENLKSLRKEKDLTQEEAAEMLGVSAQSVSKWERGDACPDITLLPALANLYKTSVDSLLGMDKINDVQARSAVFTKGHAHIRSGDYSAAAAVFSEALKTFPNDKSLMSELAMSLSLADDPEKLKQAVTLCERVLSDGQSESVHHTTRAALCFIYLKMGEKEKATTMAHKLPHTRESRETVLAEFSKEPSARGIDAYLRFIALGEEDERYAINIELGVDLIPIATEHDLTSEHNLIQKISELRTEAGNGRADYVRLPLVHVRDNAKLAPNQVRIRHYADYLLDMSFSEPTEAVREIIAAIRKTI